MRRWLSRHLASHPPVRANPAPIRAQATISDRFPVGRIGGPADTHCRRWASAQSAWSAPRANGIRPRRCGRAGTRGGWSFQVISFTRSLSMNRRIVIAWAVMAGLALVSRVQAFDLADAGCGCAAEPSCGAPTAYCGGCGCCVHPVRDLCDSVVCCVHDCCHPTCGCHCGCCGSCGEATCGCAAGPTCGCAAGPTCGCAAGPTCGCAAPTCGCAAPTCGCAAGPTCGCAAEPTCGCASSCGCGCCCHHCCLDKLDCWLHSCCERTCCGCGHGCGCAAEASCGCAAGPTCGCAAGPSCGYAAGPACGCSH